MCLTTCVFISESRCSAVTFQLALISLDTVGPVSNYDRIIRFKNEFKNEPMSP